MKFLEQSYAGLRGEETFSRDINQLTSTEKAELAPLLERTVIGASSRLERMFINDLRRRGLSPIQNFKLGPYHWDLGFPCGTTVVDLDSRIFHTAGPDNPVDNAFIIDRWKTNYAIEKGWTGLRYTDVCIREIPPSVIAQIEHTLAHRRNIPGLKKNPRHVPEMQRKAVWEFHPELFN